MFYQLVHGTYVSTYPSLCSNISGLKSTVISITCAHRKRLLLLAACTIGVQVLSAVFLRLIRQKLSAALLSRPSMIFKTEFMLGLLATLNRGCGLKSGSFKPDSNRNMKTYETSMQPLNRVVTILTRLTAYIASEFYDKMTTALFLTIRLMILRPSVAGRGAFIIKRYSSDARISRELLHETHFNQRHAERRAACCYRRRPTPL